jgi:hypothetical protein
VARLSHAPEAPPLADVFDDILLVEPRPIGEGSAGGALAFEAGAGINAHRLAAKGKPQAAAGAARGAGGRVI